MHEHKQCQCEHELKYCSNCDMVYCTKCEKEWKYNYYYYTWYNHTYPIAYYNSAEQPPIITCSHHKNGEN